MLDASRDVVVDNTVSSHLEEALGLRLSLERERGRLLTVYN